MAQKNRNHQLTGQATFRQSIEQQRKSHTITRLGLRLPQNNSHLRTSPKDIKKQFQIPGKGQNELFEIVNPMEHTFAATNDFDGHASENGGTCQKACATSCGLVSTKLAKPTCTADRQDHCESEHCGSENGAKADHSMIRAKQF
jgi:hypothetical protein